MRVLIVDDEPLARARMAALLGECSDVELVGTLADGEAALAALNELQPDVLLLDINMPGIDGVSLARRLAGRARPQVVFCTAYEAHALQAFDLGAADYLLKPVRLERLLDETPRESGAFLRGRQRGEEIRVALADVVCLLAEEKYVVVQHAGGELLIEESLRQLEEAWPDQLIRLHRNCLVPRTRLVGLRSLPDGRVLARLDGSEHSPEISRRNLAAVRRWLRLG
jgi:two-component system response regulator AlgR